MATTMIPVEEYLHTTYRPDRDYVEGVVLERNLGEFDHGNVQANLIFVLGTLLRGRGFKIIPELRIQVKPDRYRIPDVCVLLPGHPKEQVLTHPPFICFEILSPEDRVARVEARIADFLDFGVPYIWVLDTKTRAAWRYTTSGRTEVTDGFLRTESPEIVIRLADLFE